MRALMGLIKDRHGTWYAQQRVPTRLQVAVARVLGNGKPKQVYLKRSLGTKDLRAANIRAKLVLAGFDRIIGDAAAIVEQPSATPQARSSLNETEIRLMADYVYATQLAWDERWRVGGREELKRTEVELRELLKEEGRELGAVAYPYQTLPPHGWSWLPLIALFTGARQAEIAGLAERVDANLVHTLVGEWLWRPENREWADEFIADRQERLELEALKGPGEAVEF
jgi:hypothetical protein